jgi:two-component SAPR family response regulator
MNGKELSNKILEIIPDLKILFMSGYTSNVIGHNGVLEEGVQFVAKPFSRKDLADKIRAILHA